MDIPHDSYLALEFLRIKITFMKQILKYHLEWFHCVFFPSFNLTKTMYIKLNQYNYFTF